LGIEEREAGVVVVDDALESFYDAAEKFGDFAAGDEDVVDFEENLETVAFARELSLIGLGGLKIEGIVDGDGYLAGDSLHELEFGIGDALGDEAAEAHGAEAVLGGGERKDRKRADIVGAVASQEIGEARFFFGVADDKGLLCLPDPAGGVALDGRFGAGNFFAGDASFQNVEAHDIFRGVVKDEREEVEVDDGMEAASKVVEKRGKIALLGDDLADFEQGFELTPGMFKRGGERHFRRGDDGFRHRRQDNIWVGGGSTLRDARNPNHDTVIVMPANIKKLAAIASILDALLKAKARTVPVSASRAMGTIQLSEKKPSNSKVAVPHQLRIVMRIDVRPRALRHCGSFCRKPLVQPQ
jgi:hypothetical protein